MPRRQLPNIDDEYWNSLNELRRSHNLKWNDVFKQFHMYRNGIEYIFSAPDEMTKNIRLDLNTVMGLVSLWIDNIRHNWHDIEDSPDVSELPKVDSKPAIVIGAGPSLRDHDHLQRLAESDFQKNGGLILTASHSLKWCLDASVIPDFTCVIDGDAKLEEFFNHEIVDEYAEQVFGVFCASAHNNTIKRWHGDKYFFRSGLPQNLIPNVDTFLSILLPNLTELDSAGNAGGFLYNLAVYLKCDPVCMIGLDFGYPKGFPYEDTMYYNAYMRSVGTEYKTVEEMIEKCYNDYHHSYFGTDAYSDFVHEVFLNSLLDLTKHYSENLNITTINATEGGIIEGEHIKCMKFKEFLEEYGG